MTNSQNNKWEEIRRKSEEMENKQKAETAEAGEVGDEIIESKQEEGGKLEHPSYEELERKLTEVEKLADQYWKEVLRVKAEAENFRRRMERDIANAHKYSVEKMAFALLPVVDNLERCLENKAQVEEEGSMKNVYVGVELTLKAFLEVLQKFEIKQLDPRGEVFNPDLHAAMTTKEEPNTQSNTILQVVQKGYILKDRLLRPALVVVAK